MIKRFIPVIAVAVALVGFYVIAPTPGATDENRVGLFSRNRDVAEASRRVRAVGDTLRALNYALQRTVAWEIARGLAPDPAPTKVITRAGLERSTQALFEDAARAELSALGTVRVPVRLVIVPDSQVFGTYRKTTVIPQQDDQPCVVVVAVGSRARQLGPFRDDRLLGACAFYAKFGRAGTGMQSWLEASRGFAAATDTVITTNRDSDEPERIQGAQIGLAPAQAACIAGRDEGCAAHLRDPLGLLIVTPVIQSSDRTRPVFVSFASSGRYPMGQTLAAMRAYVGDERFAQIWTSEQDPVDAFQTATGEHIAVFARPILLREVLPHHPGPLRGGLSLLFGLSLGVTAGAFAITRTRRERS